jgi:hypothetical protein
MCKDKESETSFMQKKLPPRGSRGNSSLTQVFVLAIMMVAMKRDALLYESRRLKIGSRQSGSSPKTTMLYVEWSGEKVHKREFPLSDDLLRAMGQKGLKSEELANDLDRVLAGEKSKLEPKKAEIMKQLASIYGRCKGANVLHLLIYCVEQSTVRNH